eukprot:scaffold3448_cov107-Isochrysis_galbana.AAC.14
MSPCPASQLAPNRPLAPDRAPTSFYTPSVYKTVPFTPPADWRCDINYSARTKAANFDALPALGGSYCGVLLVKPDDQLTLGLKD